MNLNVLSELIKNDFISSFTLKKSIAHEKCDICSTKIESYKIINVMRYCITTKNHFCITKHARDYACLCETRFSPIYDVEMNCKVELKETTNIIEESLKKEFQIISFGWFHCIKHYELPFLMRYYNAMVPYSKLYRNLVKESKSAQFKLLRRQIAKLKITINLECNNETILTHAAGLGTTIHLLHVKIRFL
jgi:hypothetical protein